MIFHPDSSGNFRHSLTNIDYKLLFLSFPRLHVVSPFNNFRKHTEMYSIFITASDFWPTTLIKLKSTMDVFPRSFTNFARRLFPIIPCFYVKGIYNLMPVFAFKNSWKAFGKLWKLLKLLENCWKSCEGLQLFILIRFFALSFEKSLLAAANQNIVTGLPLW